MARAARGRTTSLIAVGPVDHPEIGHPPARAFVRQYPAKPCMRALAGVHTDVVSWCNDRNADRRRARADRDRPRPHRADHHRHAARLSRTGRVWGDARQDVSRLAAVVEPCRAVLAAARTRGLLVIHTREGHLPDLSDAPPAKVE